MVAVAGPTAEIGAGALRGALDGESIVFRGVPFARPPAGPLRFRPPEPAEPWSGVRVADHFGGASAQTALSAVIPGAEFQRLRAEAGEDCLYLNVWTPALDGARPVLVWIHGGSFIWGAGSQPTYDAAQLAIATDAVVVTVNYRLGALGWLCLDEADGRRVEPNLGLLDQIAALQWVRDNVRSFGGDPEQVTVAGVSAGARSIGALLASPQTQGLFRAAAMLSGGADARPREEAAALGRLFLGELGIAPAETRRLWELPVAAIVEATWRTVSRHSRKPRAFVAFEPVLDGELITEPPLDALATGRRSDLVILAGSTLDEMRLVPVADADQVAADLPAAVAELVGIDRDTAAPIIEAYRGARASRGEATDAAELYTAIDTDAHFAIPSLRVAQAQSAGGGAAFASIFAWQSPDRGAFHGLDVPFLFGTYRLPGMASFAGQGPAADAVSARLQASWKAFLRWTPGEALPGGWAPYDAATGSIMIFGGPDTLVQGSFREERQSWDGIL